MILAKIEEYVTAKFYAEYHDDEAVRRAMRSSSEVCAKVACLLSG